MTAGEWLRDRADSYARDAGVLHEQGDTDDAATMRTIAAELRRCADEVGVDDVEQSS